MKTMTCAQMGGMCDEKITASTADEMIKGGMAHLEVAHPEMAETIKTMPKDDPMIVSWSKKFMQTFEETPESAA